MALTTPSGGSLGPSGGSLGPSGGSYGVSGGSCEGLFHPLTPSGGSWWGGLQDYDVIHVVLKEQQDWRTLDEHKIEKEFLLTLPAWCRVSLTVMHPGGAPRSFTIKKATTMENLMNSYCVINNCELDDIIFLLPNGDVVSPTQTPRELKLQDGDSQQSCTNNSRSTSLCYHHCQPLPKKFVRQWPIWP